MKQKNWNNLPLIWYWTHGYGKAVIQGLAIRNQFDNRIVFVLRGEHDHGESWCIVDFPASL